MSRTCVHWIIAIVALGVALSTHTADAGGKLHRKPITINKGIGQASPMIWQTPVNNETLRSAHTGGGLRFHPRKLKLR
jgi:hypothetical protein